MSLSFIWKCILALESDVLDLQVWVIVLPSCLTACWKLVCTMFEPCSQAGFAGSKFFSFSLVPTSVFGCALVCWRVNPKRLSKDFHRSKFCVTKYSISACSWTMFVSTYVRMFEGMFEACSYVRNVRVQQFCKSSCSWKHVRMFAVNMFEGPKSCKMFVSQLRYYILSKKLPTLRYLERYLEHYLGNAI